MSQTTPTEIWFTRCGGATASTIAIQNNWLQAEFPEGSDVKLCSLLDNQNPDIRESHFDHSIPSLFREGGNIPPIWTRSKGVDTVTLGITWVDEYQTIVSRAGSQIRSIGDLAGKRLAVPLYKNVSIDFFRGSAFHGFANALGLEGLGRDDVHFVDIEIESQRGMRLGGRPSGAAELDALHAGVVDAVFLRQGTGLQLFGEQESDLQLVADLSNHPDPLRRVNNGTPRPITVHRDFLTRHRDLVVRYLAVLFRSAAWAEAHPQEAVRLIAREDGRVGEAVTAAAYPLLATSLTPSLSDAYIAGLDAQKNFLRDWGFLADDFETRDWIVEGPLEEARALVAREASLAA